MTDETRAFGARNTLFIFAFGKNKNNYGRCSFYREESINPEYIMEDVYTALTIFSNFLENSGDEQLKTAFRRFISGKAAQNQNSPEKLLIDIRDFFSGGGR